MLLIAMPQTGLCSCVCSRLSVPAKGLGEEGFEELLGEGDEGDVFYEEEYEEEEEEFEVRSLFCSQSPGSIVHDDMRLTQM